MSAQRYPGTLGGMETVYPSGGVPGIYSWHSLWNCTLKICVFHHMHALLQLKNPTRVKTLEDSCRDCLVL